MLLHQDERDGAYPTLCALRDSVLRSGGASAHGSVRRSIIVACAGYAFHCSQKIYNMVKVRARACVRVRACVCVSRRLVRSHVFAICNMAKAHPSFAAPQPLQAFSQHPGAALLSFGI